MSLRNSPIEFDGLDVSDLLPKGTERKYVVRAHGAIYLSGMLMLAHGRRDLVPLAMLWCKTLAVGMIRAGGPCEIDEEVVKDFCYRLNDELLDYEGIQMAAVEFGDAPTFNVCNLLARVMSVHPDPSSEDVMGSMLTAAGMSKSEDTLMQHVSTLVGAATFVCAMAQSACWGGRGEDSEEMSAACSFLAAHLASNFRHLAFTAYRAFDGLRDKRRMSDVWDVFSKLTCGLNDKSQVLAARHDPSPKHRRDRRWRNGKVDSDVGRLRDLTESQTIDDSFIHFIGRFADTSVAATIRSACELTKGYVQDNFDEFVPMTFMSKRAFADFERDQTTKTVWQLEKEGLLASSWHSRYSDVPLSGRGITDMRLYGERGEHIVYGILVHRAATDQIVTLAGMYGAMALTWQKSVMDCATVCLNDSASSPFVLPADRKNTERVLSAMCFARLMQWGRKQATVTSLLSSFCAGVAAPPEFVEVQIHTDLKPGHAVDVMDLS